MATKPRNWTAVHAHFRSGAGKHKNIGSRRNRGLARGRVELDDEECLDFSDEEYPDFDKELDQKACKSGSLVV